MSVDSVSIEHMFDTEAGPTGTAMPLLSARLAALDLTRLGCDLPAVLREAEQEIARLSSVVLAVIAEMGRTGPYSHSEKDYVREEVAVLCRVGAWEAQRRLTTARELDERLPALRDALAEGRVTLPQVMATACELRAVDSDVVAAQLAEQLVVGLPEQTPRKARSAAERLIRQAVPEVVEEAEARQGVSHLEWLPSRAQGRWSLYADLNASEHGCPVSRSPGAGRAAGQGQHRGGRPRHDAAGGNRSRRVARWIAGQARDGASLPLRQHSDPAAGRARLRSPARRGTC
jgi:hypothetical protein